MKSITQVYYHFMIILALSSAKAGSTGTLNKASECKSTIERLNLIIPNNDIDYLKAFLPKDHKMRKRNSGYQNNDNQDIKEYRTHLNDFNKLAKEVFSQKNEFFLIEAIADYPILLKFTTQRDQKNLLHLAVINNNLEIVKFLAKFKELINQEDSTGFSPLLLAMTGAHNIDIFEFLLTHPDVNTTIKDIWGDNIFHFVFLAQGKNRKKILDLLFKHLDSDMVSSLINSVNNEGESPFNYLIRDFDIQIARKILNETSINFSQTSLQGDNLLHTACSIPNMQAIEFLLNYMDEKIDQKNLSGLTPKQILQPHYPDLYKANIDIERTLLKLSKLLKNTK